MNRPLKRNPALQPLSREHHFALLLCWKVQKGLELHVSTERVVDYLTQMWYHQLKPHFDIEEHYVFSILANNAAVEQAVEDHRWIKNEILYGNHCKESLDLIWQRLESHIRFEERIIFPEIQIIANDAQWDEIKSVHGEAIPELNWKDQFWL